MMCGAESRTAMVATKVNRVKVMRQSLGYGVWSLIRLYYVEVFTINLFRNQEMRHLAVTLYLCRFVSRSVKGAKMTIHWITQRQGSH